MASQRNYFLIKTQNSLDFELESKIGSMGPFTPTEWLIALMTPFALTGLTMAVLFPWFRWWSIITILPWFGWFPKKILSLKKNKKRSWIFDICHRYRIIPLNTKDHWMRPVRRQIYDGRRRLVRGAWTGARKSVMLPTRPEHLTIGLPAVRIYDPVTKSFRKSITPQMRSDGYCIMNRAFLPGKSRFPTYWRHATIGRDEHGKSVIESYARVLTRWKPVTEEGR